MTMAKQKAAYRDGGPQRDGVDVDAVRIGKDVIELLTSGMYVSPITIYREYVQNAADGIDAYRARLPVGGEVPQGRVAITIDHAARSVAIRDDGAAIASRDAAATLLAIGGSPKRGTTARGFRGVGRLSGLAFCRELEFRSKAEGEVYVNCVAWDCRELRRRLADGTSRDDLRSIVAACVSVWREEPEAASEHFFEVRLLDVARHRQDLLLNEKVIAQYLGEVAPVAFAPDFSFGPEIDERLVGAGVKRYPIALEVNGVPVYRPYRDRTPLPASPHTVDIGGVEFVEFADVDGEVGAIGWIAHHQYVRGIPAGIGIRGLRARIGDVQVGLANLFDEVYREPRFNGWTIGEVHVIDRRIVPNGRRDDFEVNHHTYNLLAQLGPLASNVANRCRTASVGRNAEQTISLALEEAERRLSEAAALDGPEMSRLRGSLVRARSKLKSVPDAARRGELDIALQITFDALAGRRSVGAPALALDEAKTLIGRIVTNRQQARELIAELNRLCAVAD